MLNITRFKTLKKTIRKKSAKKAVIKLFFKMPQFDTFSFFSQLFWVFLAFSYLYLVLCFYLLPAFAAILKVRAKKLGQINTLTSTTNVITTSKYNIAFFENLTITLGGIFFFRKSLTNDINIKYSYLLYKNNAFYQFNFLMLHQLKIVTFFV